MGGQIEEIVGSKSIARQCLVAAILHQPEVESSAFAIKGLIAIKNSKVSYQWISQGGEM